MDFLDCKICHNPYDEENHRPRSAPCGHELCTSCIRGLIKDSTLLCPKCRKVSKVEVPDDLPINFGLIDVIRGFKTMDIPLTKESESIQSGATNDELCSIHCKAISHWCLKCQMWICEDCLKSHSSLIGCSTEAMQSLKDKHIKNTDKLLTVYEEDIIYVSAKLQEHTKLAEKHWEEAKKLSNVLEQGNTHKNKLLESKKHLNTEKIPHVVIDRIKELTQREQGLKNWSVMNLGFSRAFAVGKNVFTVMEIGYEKRYSNLTQHEDFFYFHTFKEQAVADDSICMPFDRLKKLISSCPSLVFLELSLGGVVKGRILIRLNKELQNLREYIVHIFTGQKGKSLNGVQFNNARDYALCATKLEFSEMQITADKRAGCTANREDVIGYFGNGYLQTLFFYLRTQPDKNTFALCHKIGVIEEGLDILLECHNEFSRGVMISDCGLVIYDNKDMF